MNFEPQKFFIGLIDFFSIILPGALLTWFVGGDLACYLLSPTDYARLMNGNNAIVAFLFGSYLLGHFIFLFGAMLDPLYDRIRTGTPEGCIDRLAKGKATPWRLTRGLAWWWLKSDPDRAVRLAERIRDCYLERVGDKHAENAFQWSKARLALTAPTALAIVNRFEADSKFFRSLVVVLIVLVLWSWWPWSSAICPVSMTFVGVPLLLLAFWRYFDQRAKATDQAYWFVISQEAAAENGYRVPGSQAGGLTHAGGVVFRRTASGHIEYLLVQASQNPDDWVLPKGHIEHGESTVDAAIREVREETGIRVLIRSELGDISFNTPKEQVRARFFLMAEEGTEPESHETRGSQWLPIDKALAATRYEETKHLLQRADEQLHMQADALNR